MGDRWSHPALTINQWCCCMRWAGRIGHLGCNPNLRSPTHENVWWPWGTLQWWVQGATPPLVSFILPGTLSQQCTCMYALEKYIGIYSWKWPEGWKLENLLGIERSTASCYSAVTIVAPCFEEKLSQSDTKQLVVILFIRLWSIRILMNLLLYKIFVLKVEHKPCQLWQQFKKNKKLGTGDNTRQHVYFVYWVCVFCKAAPLFLKILCGLDKFAWQFQNAFSW